MLNLGSAKAFATGHNHCAGYAVMYDDVIFRSVPKTGDLNATEIHDNYKRGGLL